MKPSIVLLHGWAMPPAIFKPLVKRLSYKFDFIIPKFPGDIGHAYRDEASLQDFAQSILQQVRHKAIWLGWSFGGLLAMQIAKSQPKLVESLIMVTSNLKYVQDESWEYGIKSEVLAGFFQDLQNNYNKTISQFLGLQTMYASNQRDLIKDLKSITLDRPAIESLMAQLKLLQTTDLRQDIKNIPHNTLWIMGDKDMLVPYNAGLAASKLMTQSKVKIIKNSGHLPFWTQPQEFDNEIIKWAS